MVDRRYFDVLTRMCSVLNSTDIDWAVTGSFNLALQNVPVKPDDIDVHSDIRGVYRIGSLFSGFVVQQVAFSSLESLRSHFGVLCFQGVRVEIVAAAEDLLEDGTWKRHRVNWKQFRQIVEIKGVRVPLLSLEHEYQIYRDLGQHSKAQKIKEHLHLLRSLKVSLPGGETAVSSYNTHNQNV